MLLEFEKAWSDLNVRLRGLEFSSGLTAALRALEIQQRESGLIQDSLQQVERHTFYHPDDPARYFHVQYNPRRALRFTGLGRQPTHLQNLNDGCLLCRENIQWRQKGMQLGYQIETGDKVYFALMNPFPLLPGHVVIASSEHRSQDWRFRDDDGLDVAILLDDLVRLGARMPGHLGFYNGVDAGASNRDHLHYQFIMRPDGKKAFPLEAAARAVSACNSGPGFTEHYPLDVAVWKGDVEDVVARACDWIASWSERNRRRLSGLSANFIVSQDIDDGDVTLYFVPRDRAKSRAEGFSGLIGGLEVLGEVVLSSPEEKTRLTDGLIDYCTLKAALASVHTPINAG